MAMTHKIRIIPERDSLLAPPFLFAGIESVAMTALLLAAPRPAVTEKQQAAATWESPTGHTDPDSKWNNETNAYDDDDNDNPKTSADIERNDRDFWLELNLGTDAIWCDMVRVYAAEQDVVEPYEYHDPYLHIDVHYEGDWHNIWSGTVTKSAWVQKAIPAGAQKLSKMRIRGDTISGWPDCYLYLYELDFRKQPVLEMCCDGLTGVPLLTNRKLEAVGQQD